MSDKIGVNTYGRSQESTLKKANSVARRPCIDSMTPPLVCIVYHIFSLNDMQVV